MAEEALTQKQQQALYTKLKNARKTHDTVRYFLKFKRKGDYYRRSKTGKWPRAVWPILFHTREEAELAVQALPVFFGRDKKDSRRFISISIERTTLKRKQTA